MAKRCAEWEFCSGFAWHTGANASRFAEALAHTDYLLTSENGKGATPPFMYFTSDENFKIRRCTHQLYIHNIDCFVNLPYAANGYSMTHNFWGTVHDSTNQNRKVSCPMNATAGRNYDLANCPN